jgi:hypothetical protein
MNFGITRMSGYKELKFIVSLREDVFGLFTYKVQLQKVIPKRTEWYIDQIVNENELIELQLEMTKKAHATALHLLHEYFMYGE